VSFSKFAGKFIQPLFYLLARHSSNCPKINLARIMIRSSCLSTSDDIRLTPRTVDASGILRSNGDEVS
jgi:hypothetical protein